MIRVRNQDDLVVDVSVVGALTTGRKYAVTVPFACFLSGVYARVGTAGTQGGGGTTLPTVDINKEGTSVFSSGGITFASGSRAASYAAFSTNPASFAKGDLLSVDVDVLFNGATPAPVQPSDLGVNLVLRRTKPAETLTDKLDNGVGL